MRVAIVVAVACLSGAGLCTAQEVQASIKKPTNIPAQELVPALKTLAYERGFQLVFRSEVVGAKHTQGAVGDLTTTEALTSLLEGTNLAYSYLNDKTVTIAPVDSNNKSDQGDPAAASSQLQHCAELPGGKSGYARSLDRAGPGSTAIGWSAAAGASGCGESYSRENQLLATRIAGAEDLPVRNNAGDSNSNKESTAGSVLEEVVVSAQKRAQNLLDVPVPVTAISAQSLLATNQVRLQDYYTSVPGLNVSQGGGFFNAPNLSIRGITTGGGATNTNPTVAIVVDDVPYGPSSAIAGANDAPDFDPSDLARVEVLRGPQGTLYGASSIGGLIKFVTVDPSIDRVSGRAQVGVSDVRNGAEIGYNVRGAVNVPLSDTLAVRLSGFARRDPGYIDDPINHLDGVNDAKVYGGRLSALYKPSDTVSLKLSALLQHHATEGSPEVDQDPSLGDLQQNRLRGTGWYHKTLQAYSATLTARLGSVDVTAASGYNINHFAANPDFTYAYGPFLGPVSQQYLGIPDVPGTTVPFNNRTRKFSQEIRASASINERFEWLLGVFYTHENTDYHEGVLATDSKTGQALGTWATESFPIAFTEYAVFSDLTWHVTERFDVQFGGRESKNRQTYSELDSGPLFSFFYGAPAIITPEVETRDNSFTYLVTPRLKVTPDLMVYARVASGYRTGGPNSNYVFLNVPSSFRPDKTKNYELGIKGNVPDHPLSFDASLYYIDWKDIQLGLIDPASFGSYVGNASGAKSQGLELSVESHPWQGFSLSSWIAWNDAVLTRALPSIPGSPYGASGDRLPSSSRYSGNVSAQQDFPITGRVTAFAGGSVSYVGNQLGLFTATPAPFAVPPRQLIPGYARVDLRAGAKCDGWEISAFVTNLTDRRALLAGGLGTLNPAAYFFIQPRTAGVSLAKEL